MDKCIGCRACEASCSAFHSTPKYSSVNPARSRIRVLIDDLKDAYVPIRAGDYAPAECMSRNKYTINGKEYWECGFCKASCGARNYFKDPDTGFPLRCDMCENDPPLEEPLCVQVCRVGALTYEERIGETGKDSRDKIQIDLDAMIHIHGLQQVISTLTRIANRATENGKIQN